VRGAFGHDDRPTERNLLRIGQEAITNAARHANASTVVADLPERDGPLPARVGKTLVPLLTQAGQFAMAGDAVFASRSHSLGAPHVFTAMAGIDER
jgi:hypothetical protein